MFDPSQGIEVRLKKFGSPDPYPEYKANSKSKYYAESRNEAFIVPVSNERFVIEVILHPVFQWKKCSAVKLAFRLDGSWTHFCEDIKRPAATGEAIKFELKTFTNFIEARKRECGLTFGETKMVDDSAFMTAEEETTDLERRGVIKVEVQRGRWKEIVKKKKKTKTKRTENQESTTSQPLETMFLSEESIKKVSADRGRSHYMKPLLLPQVMSEITNDRADSDDDGSEHEYSQQWVPSKGAGEVITFKFTYAARAFLERESIAPWMTFLNTEDTAVEIDAATISSLPTPLTVDNGSSTIVPPQSLSGVKRPAGGAEVTYISTKHVGQQKRIKIENEDGMNDWANDHGSAAVYPFRSYDKTAWTNGAHDKDDEEPCLQSNALRETTEDLYSATPPPIYRAPSLSTVPQPGLPQLGSLFAQAQADRESASAGASRSEPGVASYAPAPKTQASPSSTQRASGQSATPQAGIAEGDLDEEAQLEEELRKIDLQQRLRAVKAKKRQQQQQ
ncbi:hypothetical protein LTR86_000381 [Recurvomyces mirabilis]|nr:hypothetical protein LTR86_000381 [Recurvomyces mirabilis]